MNQEKHNMKTIVEKYIIWNAQKKEWFRPTYPGARPGKNGKMVNHIVTEEILFSMSGEMYMRKNTGIDKNISASIIDCDQLEHVSADLFIPCLYIGLKDSNDQKIYEGHIVKITPECDEEFNLLIQYDASATSWNPYMGEYGYTLGDVKNQLQWRVQIIGHILENPEMLIEK